MRVFFLLIFGSVLISCNKAEDTSDPYPPFIVLKGNNPVWSQPGEAYNDAGAEAFDITANRDTINISARLETTDNVNIEEIGVYKVFYNVSDAAGNQAEPQERTVYVNRFK